MNQMNKHTRTHTHTYVHVISRTHIRMTGGRKTLPLEVLSRSSPTERRLRRDMDSVTLERFMVIYLFEVLFFLVQVLVQLVVLS